jgi:hypothetical protein
MFVPQAHGLDWMRGLNRATPIVSLAAALTGATCAFPTDKSESVFVTVAVARQVVLRGDTLKPSATLWRRIGTDSTEIKNVVFRWESDNAAIATVRDEGYGGAEVTGVRSGLVTITVRAVAFEKAQTAYITLRVANPLEVDSVRPKLAHHGEIITLYGVGVDSLFIASLAGVNLIEYPFSRVRDSSGTGRISFWIPPPARSDSLFYLGAGVFGFDTARTNVLFRDVFEPNDTVATNLNLDVPGPWPGTLLGPVIFTNPALAFEPVERNTSGQDWYRFATNDTTQALTFFIQYPSLAGDTSGTRIFLIDSLYYLANGDPTKDPIEKFFGRDSADFIGSAFYRCKGFTFGPPQAPRESTTIALKNLPSHALHVLTNFERPQRYGLTVAKGYFTADPRIPPDAYEENDMCHFADAGNRRIPLPTAGSTFSDAFTIDNPHELDWLRIDLPSGGPFNVRLRADSRPLPGTVRDTSDIDLYLLTTPDPATGVGLNLVALDTAKGPVSDIIAALPGGASYYVAVVDFAGVPTPYSLCITRGLTCAFIPSAPMTPRVTAPLGPRGVAPRRGSIVEPAPTGRNLFRRPSRQ